MIAGFLPMGMAPPPPPPPPPVAPASPATVYKEAAARGESAFNAYAMDLTRTLCCLMGVGPTVAFRAQALFQRLMAVVRRVETDRLTQSTPLSIPRDVNPQSSPDCLEVQQLRSITDYEDVFHRLEGLRFTDDSVLYFVAAVVIITCKLECPQARIRLAIHAVHRLNYRRKQRVQPIAGSLAAAATLPPIRPEVYDALKRQVVQAEWIVLIQLGFQVTVECPHKFVFPFLAFMIDRSASTESNDLVVSWSLEACKWLNDCPRSGDVNGFDATVLACVALGATTPLEFVHGLPIGWTCAFGVTVDALKECIDAIGPTPAKNISAAPRVDAEVAKYQVAKLLLAEGRSAVFNPPPSPPHTTMPPAPVVADAHHEEVPLTPAAVAALLDIAAPSSAPSTAVRSPLVTAALVAAPPPPPMPSIDIGDVLDIAKRKDKKEKRDKKDKRDDRRDYSPVGGMTAGGAGERMESQRGAVPVSVANNDVRKRSRSFEGRGGRRRGSSSPEASRRRRDGSEDRRDNRRDDGRRYRDDRYRDERDDRYQRDDRDDRYQRDNRDRGDRHRLDDRDSNNHRGEGNKNHRDGKYRDEGPKRNGDGRGGRR